MTKAKAVLLHGEDSKTKKPRLKKNDGSNTTESGKAIIGQEVHGIVDGSFDAGYLLTVKLGDSPLVFRGLVFEPGMLAPLSKTNDIAPTIQVTTRNQQVAFPSSDEGAPVVGELSLTARASIRVATGEGPADLKQKQEERPSISGKVPSVEQGSMEPSNVSEDVKPSSVEKEIAVHGDTEAQVANITEPTCLDQGADQKDI